MTFPVVLTLCATEQGSKSFRTIPKTSSLWLIAIYYYFPLLFKVSPHLEAVVYLVLAVITSSMTLIFYIHMSTIVLPKSIVKLGHIINLDNLLKIHLRWFNYFLTSCHPDCCWLGRSTILPRQGCHVLIKIKFIILFLCSKFFRCSFRIKLWMQAIYTELIISFYYQVVYIKITAVSKHNQM